MGKELKSLNRRELIEIIYQLKKSEQELQNENAKLQELLEEKRIALQNVGSIADASLALTDIFKAAQSSADLYLAEIERRYADVERQCADFVDDARKRADEIVEEAMKQKDEIVRETKNMYILLKKYEAEIEKKKIELASYNDQEQ